MPRLVHNSLMSRQRSVDPDPATRLGDQLDLLAGLITVGLLALTLLDRSGMPRLLLTVAFVGYVPGRAIIANWPLFARWSEAALSMICSVMVLGLVATVALWSRFWHPVGLFQAEAAITLAGLVIAAARRHRCPPNTAERARLARFPSGRSRRARNG